MDLELSDDQRMLKDMVDRFVTDRYDFETRTKITRSAAHWSRDVWRELAELGLLMITVPEDDGGLAGGGVAAMIVGEATGKALLVEPFLPSAIMATAALAEAPDAIRADVLPMLMDGSKLAAVVLDNGLTLTDGIVSGHAKSVLGADTADMLLLFVKDSSGGDNLVLVDATDPGVERDAFALRGGGNAADLTFNGVTIKGIVAGPNRATAIGKRVSEAAIAFLAAEALGAAQAAFDLTVEYLKTRVQFGKPIGQNQALQHRAAEMLVELEQLRSAAMYAAVMVDDEDADARERAIASIKIVVGKSARFIGQQAVQLHGGIGVTEEYVVGQYFKRLTAISLLFGDSEEHIAILAAAGGLVAAAPYWADV